MSLFCGEKKNDKKCDFKGDFGGYWHVRGGHYLVLMIVNIM